MHFCYWQTSPLHLKTKEKRKKNLATSNNHCFIYSQFGSPAGEGSDLAWHGWGLVCNDLMPVSEVSPGLVGWLQRPFMHFPIL